MVLSKNNISENPANRGIFYLKAFLWIVLLSGIHSVNAQAKAYVNEPKREFGKVKKGEQLEFVYPVLNKGTQPLLIQPYEADCSCTTVEVPQKPILPGDSAMVKIKFNTGMVYDRQDRVVKLTTNGGMIKLRFKGFVQRVN